MTGLIFQTTINRNGIQQRDYLTWQEGRLNGWKQIERWNGSKWEAI